MGRKSQSRKTLRSTKEAEPERVDQLLDQLFYNYANKSSGTIEPEGIEALCSDAGLSVTDVRVLMLAWKMEAERQGYFTLEEWRKGFQALNIDTISKLKGALRPQELKKESSKKFAEFYSYAFQYCLTEERQKSVELESVCELLGMVLRSKFPPQVDALIEYLKDQKEYKVINMDQWMGILRFCNDISFPDFSNYDSGLAWPLILDDFVDWIRERKI